MIGKATRRSFISAVAALPLATSSNAASLAPSITALAFSPDGTVIVAGSQAGLNLRDAGSGQVTQSLSAGIDNIYDMQFSPDANTLLVAGGTPAESGAADLLRWPTLDRQQQLRFGDDVIYDVDFSADGSRFVAAAGDEICTVFEPGNDQPAGRFIDHSRSVLAAVWLPDGETVVSGSRDETLRVWNADSGENVRTLHNHSRDVFALAVQPAGEGLPLVASSAADLTVRFWQPTIGRMVKFARLPSAPLCIAWCCGNRLIAGCRDGAARLIDPQTVQIERTVPVSDGWLFAVAVNPRDDRQVAVGSTNGQVVRLVL